MTHKLILKRLTRRPQAASGDELLFTTGVNVMVGGKDSGKTKWLTLLDYLLGSTERPEDALGEDIAAKYNSIEAEFRVGDVPLVLARSWGPADTRGKVLVNGVDTLADSLSRVLLEMLGIPEVHYPRGDPFAERAWSTLSFRALYRHIYRQERFWSDFADKQPTSEQHACLALFLGVAEALFPSKWGDLVAAQKALDEVTATRAAHQLVLDKLTIELVHQKEISVSVTEVSVGEAEARIRAEIATLEGQRETLIESVRKQGDAQVDERVRAAKTRGDRIGEQVSDLEAELGRTRRRMEELGSYQETLAAESQRFDRAVVSGGLLANLRVTHCPVCDRPVETDDSSGTCCLCRRPHEPTAAHSNDRVDFEQAQLTEEKDEIVELVRELESKSRALEHELVTLRAERATIERDLRGARAVAMTLLPPDLTMLDQSKGKLQEQLESLLRVRKALSSQVELTRKIAELSTTEALLKSELTARRAETSLTEVSAAFENRLNEYLNAINAGDQTRWTHGPVSFRLKPRGFDLAAKERLGATSQALLLFAYHYALLSLAQDSRFLYPGLVIIDFPLQLADGVSIRDKENYLIEPFVALCSRPEMAGAQVVAAGHSFEGLDGAHEIPIARPSVAMT